MDWAPIVILVLLVLLTVMTVIGHGIWVLLATIFGGGRSKAASRLCGFCGRPTPVDHAKCDWCGRDQHRRWLRNWPTSWWSNGSCGASAKRAP